MSADVRHHQHDPDNPHDGLPPAVRLVLRLEAATGLDGLSRALTPVADALLASPQRRRLLHGTPAGHAIHPPLTDVPIGAWVGASFLDLTGGKGSAAAADRLLALGLVTAVPAVATGLAEWGTTIGGARRVGVVHAGANTVAFGLYASSYLARRRGRRGLGVLLALAGGSAAGAGGFLGGHLAAGRKVSTRHPAFDDYTAG